MHELRKSILAGMAIGLGCIAYISVENRYVGALLFSIGLLTICGLQWNLFTGKLCRCTIHQNIKMLSVTLFGNLIGSLIMYLLYLYTAKDASTAIQIAEKKFQTGYLNGFVLGILCEICIYIAVIGYKNIRYDIGRYLSIMLGVMVFILCGFEHSVADMFYYFVWLKPLEMEPMQILRGTLYLLVVILGNVAGAVIINFLDKETKNV